MSTQTPTPSPKTGQTGQEPPVDMTVHLPAGEEARTTREPYYEVAQDKTDGSWHWVLWSGNGIAMATNATAYKRRNDCTVGVQKLHAMLANSKLQIVIRHE